jgi:catechol 2,3-dioxygenase-like lactoylglutathione lyase family enzyme
MSTFMHPPSRPVPTPGVLYGHEQFVSTLDAVGTDAKVRRRASETAAGRRVMVKHFDHVTVVVRDVERAKRFFGLLGFREDKSVVIQGEPFVTYMGVDGIEAEHVTLVLDQASPRTEVQLLCYRHPAALPNPDIARLNRLGFNHICFAVEDIEAEVANLKANGVPLRNEIMDFHGRKLVFVTGPEGIIVELAEWR